jgi:hypothetical protein
MRLNHSIRNLLPRSCRSSYSCSASFCLELKHRRGLDGTLFVAQHARCIALPCPTAAARILEAQCKGCATIVAAVGGCP